MKLPNAPSEKEEEKAVEDQIANFMKTAHPSEKDTPEAPLVEPTKAPAKTAVKPATSEPAAPATPAAESEDIKETVKPKAKTGGERTIQPLNDLSKLQPDLNALLAKEESKNPVEPPAANTVIAPVAPPPAEEGEEATPNASDPGNIAL